MNNQISNPKTEVPQTQEMNDKDYLNCLLAIEKNMSNDFNIALNEASNEHLYNQIKEMFESVRNLQRQSFECAFKLGWYKLEKAENTKIKEKYNMLNNEMKQL